MVYQIRKVWLLLVLSGVESLIFHQTNYEIDKPTSDYYHISFDSNLPNSIVFATTNETGTPPLVFKIDVTLGEKSSKQYKQCSLLLAANKNAESVGLNSLKRMGGSMVLLETYEQIKSGNRYTTLVIINIYSCQIEFPLALQFSEKNIVHKTSKRNGTYKQLDIFTADKVVCKNLGDKCLIRYHQSYSTIEPLQIDLVWSSLRIERTFKDNVYLMCGLNGSGKYQVELYNITNYKIHKELISLSYVEGMQLITSDLAVCWILDTKNENTTVYCSQFDQTGALIFSSTITYKKQVKLIFLYNVRPGKIVLLTGLDQISLSRIYITIVERDNLSKPIDDHQINLECTGSATQMVFDAERNEYRGIDNMIEIVYVCLGHDNKFHHNTISIVNK